MRKEHLSYFNQLGLVLWIRRAEESSTQSFQSQASFSPTPGAKPRSQPWHQSLQSKASEAAQAVVQSDTAPIATRHPTSQNPQEVFAFRYEAVVIPPVVVLYEITGRVELAPQENQLLNSMLIRCGLDISNKKPTISLPWPPLLPSFSQDSSADEANETAAQEAYEGFLTSIVENNACDWLILMGKNRLKAQVSSLKEIIQLDSLRLLCQEPQRRKKAWEQLSSLRDELRTHPNDTH